MNSFPCGLKKTMLASCWPSTIYYPYTAQKQSRSFFLPGVFISYYFSLLQPNTRQERIKEGKAPSLRTIQQGREVRKAEVRRRHHAPSIVREERMLMLRLLPLFFFKKLSTWNGTIHIYSGCSQINQFQKLPHKKAQKLVSQEILHSVSFTVYVNCHTWNFPKWILTLLNQYRQPMMKSIAIQNYIYCNIVIRMASNILKVLKHILLGNNSTVSSILLTSDV